MGRVEIGYEVSFKGAASDTLCSAFDDCGVTIAPGRTIVACPPARLHDVLDRLQTFGLELLDVRLVARARDG